MKRLLLIPLLFCALTSPAFSDDLPDPAAVTAAMKKAAGFYRKHLSVQGGYASQWPIDLKVGRTEHSASPTVISIQPPGTTTVGLAMLEAWRATGEEVFLEGARGAASALVWCQLASGGWSSDFDFAPKAVSRYYCYRNVLAGDTEPGKRRNRSTLDDNKTQSALLLLVELANEPGIPKDEDLVKAKDYALAKLIGAQESNGAWPQQYTTASVDRKNSDLRASFPETWPRKWPKVAYHQFSTLNDGNLYHIVRLLLRAYDLEKNPAYLDSAKRCGEFLLKAQLPEPQRGWAQQYDENMHPVWARKFEPPAVSSVESYGAIQTLFEIWVATGEKRFIETLPAAFDWLVKSQLDNKKWARFYELETNRPLYCDADDYSITYSDSNLPTHYGFQVSSDYLKKIEYLKKDLARGPESILRSRQGPSSPDKWPKIIRSLSAKLKPALRDQKESGYWVSGNLIDAKLFVKHIRTMSAYVDARQRSGF